jgi:carbon-monoxide dehydrogenase large subunit
VGEAGTIAATPAIVNAVIDALRPVGVSYIDMPLSPQSVWAKIQEAQGNGVPGAGDPGKQGGTWDEHGSGSAGSGPTSPSEGGGL